MQFDLIRLVLVSRAQTSLFEPKTDGGVAYDREGWLRLVFREDIVFMHREQEFVFKPQLSLQRAPKYIIARVGRQISSIENEPPEKNFTEITRDTWRASNLIIDPTHHPDGQKLAFQVKGDVGGAMSIIKSLANHINLNAHAPYIMEASPIVNPQTFWDFERDNRGEIVSISFELLAPNMVGIRDQLTRDLTEFRDNEKARRVKIGLQNEEGLALDAQRVKEMVDYTMDGGGSVRASTRRRKKTYNSNDKGTRVRIDTQKDIDNSSLSATIYDAVNKLFGGGDE
jgi:hypothetical protein